jgi:hypothetical protein
MSDKSKFYYFGKCIKECLETRKLKQGTAKYNGTEKNNNITRLFTKYT